MKNLIQFSVNKAITVFMVVLAISVFGIVSFTRITTDLFPNINIPFAVVVTTYPGATPDEVEQEVSVPLENAFQTTTNVVEVTSTSQENFSLVTLEFGNNVNMDSAVIEMRESLNQMVDSLPDSAGNPMIIRLNPDMLPILTFSISYEGLEIEELTNWVEDELRPQIERVPGVASMTISGGYESEMRVMLDRDAIDAFNASLPPSLDFELNKEYIGDVLSAQNFSFPSGFVTISGVDYLVRVGDGIEDLESLENLQLFDMFGFDLTLNDIADIEFVPANERTYSKVNGEDAITISIQKGSDYATTDVTEAVQSTLASLSDEDSNIQATTLLDQGDYINQATGSVINNLLIGGLLAIIVLFVFLRSVRATFIVGVAIPISLLFAVVLIYASGITFNIVSLGGLALGIGMLVDNSIVVMENIFRLKKQGVSNKEAALYGTHQVGGAIMASTLTTVGVFLPMLFAEDFIRDIFIELALTVSFSLIASLFIALTLVPSLASKVLKEENTEEKALKTTLLDRIQNTYEKVLNVLFKVRGLIISGVLVLFVVSIFLATSNGFEFFPATDEGTLNITVEMDPEDPLEFEEFTERLDNLYEDLNVYDDVETIGISLGGGMFMLGMGGGSLDSATVNVVLSSDRKMTTEAFRNEVISILDADYSDLIYEVSGTQGDISMLVGEGIQVQLSGIELDTMREEAEKIAALLEDIEGVREVDPGFGLETNEIKITVDKDLAASYLSVIDGNPLTVESVWMMVAGQLQTPQSVGTIRLENQNYSIYIYDEGDTASIEFNDIDAIENFVVGIDPTTQTPVTVGDVAAVSIQPGFASINRVNGVRTLTISTTIETGYNAALVAQDIETALEDYELPTGYDITFLGENEEIMNALETLLLVGALAILLVYMIMASQFQSLIYPFIIMITIPLAFTGGFLILYIFNMPVSVIAVVGLIVLAGVVVNNGIVLVDYINQLRAKGLELKEAIVEAGKVRIRPIFMTAITTILAMIGLAIGFGEGAELMQPLALTAIGGLIYATFLTIFVVPMIYYSVTLHGRLIIGTLFSVVAASFGATLIVQSFILYGILALVLAVGFILLTIFLPKRTIEIEQDIIFDENKYKEERM